MKTTGALRLSMHYLAIWLCVLALYPGQILAAKAQQISLPRSSPGSLLHHTGLDGSASKWKAYVEGQPTWSLMNAAKPSLDGRSLKCSLTGGDPYSNVHCYLNLPSEPHSNSFALNLAFYYQPDSSFNNAGGVPSVVQALEFTVSKWYQGLRYELALQWDNVDTGAPKWRYWDPNHAPQWVDIGLSGGVTGLEWHTLTLEGGIVNDQVHYRRLVIDQQPYPLDITVDPAVASGETDRLAVAVQLDGNSEQTPYDLFLDRVAITTGKFYEINPVPPLIWSDEFNGSSVNRTNWNFDLGGGGWGNHEAQCYTNGKNVTIQDDVLPNRVLVIESRQENGNGCQYTSARMTTKGKHQFKYGRIEARMKLPSGDGLWPAFWMLGGKYPAMPWPRSGEIDIMEHRNMEDIVYGTAHWDVNHQHAQYGVPCTGFVPPVLDVTQYHTYDIEWDANYIRWHVDGNLYCALLIENQAGGTEEFQKPFFLLLNLAVGGDWPGIPPDDSVFPTNMYVDYVRVYSDIAAAPALTSPANNALLSDLTPRLDWKDTTAAAFDHYRIQIASDSAFQSVVIDTSVYGITLSEYAPPVDLASNSRFYWHVQTCSSSGQCGAWSAKNYFRTRLAAPVLLSPANAVQVPDRKPTYSWSAVPEAASYRLQVSTSATFDNLLVNSTTAKSTYKMLKNLPAGKTIYWRVRANGENGPSAWMAAQFTTP